MRYGKMGIKENNIKKVIKKSDKKYDIPKAWKFDEQKVNYNNKKSSNGFYKLLMNFKKNKKGRRKRLCVKVKR